jgi:hypothetical protein
MTWWMWLLAFAILAWAFITTPVTRWLYRPRHGRKKGGPRPLV